LYVPVRKQVDRRIEEGFPPFLYEAGKEVSLGEMLQARRRAGSIQNAADNDGTTTSSSRGDLNSDQQQQLQGVSNQAADDDDNCSQANGQPQQRRELTNWRNGRVQKVAVVRQKAEISDRGDMDAQNFNFAYQFILNKRLPALLTYLLTEVLHFGKLFFDK